jgi:hypothetical protein
MASGPESIDTLIDCLLQLDESVRTFFESGVDIEATLAANRIPSGQVGCYAPAQ